MSEVNIMATKENISEKKEVVANCDQLGECVVNSDELTLSGITFAQQDIEKMIFTIRGVQVMIDRDLAAIYEVEIRALNQAVKRNIERFPEDFMFQLTKEEWHHLQSQIANAKYWGNQDTDFLTSQNVILKNKARGQHRKYLPFVFTQAGVAMLSGLLHSKIAVEANIRIMRAFVGMQRFLGANAQIYQRLERVELQQLDNKQWMQATENQIEIILNKIEESSPKLLPEQIFQTGCVWDAWAYVSDLVRSAKRRIVLIDNFVDDRVLSMLDKRADCVSATIHSRYYGQFQVDLKKHNEQYTPINFVQLPHRNHDRFLIIDDKVYLMGASLKDMGAGLCAVTELQTSPETILAFVR